jgi:uncharacterized protein
VVRFVAIGLVAGVFSSLFGVGGGIVIVPLLLVATHLTAHQATATSLGAIMITAVAGVVIYAAHGDVHTGYAALVGVPAMIGALAGSSLKQRMSGRGLTFLFAGLLVAIGVWLIVG